MLLYIWHYKQDINWCLHNFKRGAMKNLNQSLFCCCFVSHQNDVFKKYINRTELSELRSRHLFNKKWKRCSKNSCFYCMCRLECPWPWIWTSFFWNYTKCLHYCSAVEVTNFQVVQSSYLKLSLYSKDLKPTELLKGRAYILKHSEVKTNILAWAFQTNSNIWSGLNAVCKPDPLLHLPSSSYYDVNEFIKITLT